MKQNPEKSVPLLVLGDFAWDVLIRTNSPLLPGGDTFGEVLLAAGGSAANAAVWASRCGLHTEFVGKVGRDRLGQLALENLEWEKVNPHFIFTEMHRTASVAVWIDQQAQRSMVSGRGADFYLLTSELPEALFKKCDHLHLTAWSFFTDPPRAAALKAAQIAAENKATISFDPASFQIINDIGVEKFLKRLESMKIDLLFPNLQEGATLSGLKKPEDIIRKLNDIFPGAEIILKLDSKGAMLLKNGNPLHIPPATDTIIDATGAGDSFAGAFLSKYLKGMSLEKSVKFAVSISSWVINRIGARPTPDAALKKLLNSKESASK